MSSLLENMIGLIGLTALTYEAALPAIQAEVKHSQTTTISRDPAWPYISSSLKIIYPSRQNNCSEDLTIEGTVYRRLDPDYFAWLHARMLHARKAHKTGKLTEKVWNELQQRFEKLRELALEIYDRPTLIEAVESFDPHDYQPPIITPEKNDWTYPANGAWMFTQAVTSKALAQVDAIKDKALACGWSEVFLYQNRGQYKFPCGQEYGLVCHLDGHREIGAVTEKCIEIISHGKAEQRSILRFYNPDVPQPWLKEMEV